MQVIIKKDNLEGSRAAFDIFKNAMANEAKVFGLATGSTPLPLYKEMIASDLDFSNLTSINLDEYVGLSADNSQSYHYFMQKNLFDKKPFKKSYVPDGLAAMKDAKKVSSDYDKIIQENPIDVQLLGLGQNGHIAFNEPGTAFDSLTHEVNLTKNTIKANSRFFSDINEVPTSAVCMGIANIMSAKKIVLLAFGENKADAVQKMIEGPITEKVPASILQNHPDVTIILDEKAASKLDNN